MGKLCKKPEKKKRLKNFPVGYVGRFYRNLADNVNTFLGFDFYGRIVNDADIPSEDICWLLVTFLKAYRTISTIM